MRCHGSCTCYLDGLMDGYEFGYRKGYRARCREEDEIRPLSAQEHLDKLYDRQRERALLAISLPPPPVRRSCIGICSCGRC